MLLKLDFFGFPFKLSCYIYWPSSLLRMKLQSFFCIYLSHDLSLSLFNYGGLQETMAESYNHGLHQIWLHQTDLPSISRFQWLLLGSTTAAVKMVILAWLDGGGGACWIESGYGWMTGSLEAPTVPVRWQNSTSTEHLNHRWKLAGDENSETSPE